VFLACIHAIACIAWGEGLSVVGQVLVSTCKCRDRRNLILPIKYGTQYMIGCWLNSAVHEAIISKEPDMRSHVTSHFSNHLSFMGPRCPVRTQWQTMVMMSEHLPPSGYLRQMTFFIETRWRLQNSFAWFLVSRHTLINYSQSWETYDSNICKHIFIAETFLFIFVIPKRSTIDNNVCLLINK